MRMQRTVWVALIGLLAVGCGDGAGPTASTGPAPAAATKKAATVTTGQAESPPAEPQRGLMRAVTVEAGPAIDGTLQSPVWAKCPPLELGECTSEKPLSRKTVAKVLFDPTRLYVAFDCAENDTDGLVQDVTERDGDVWSDDCVELFITGDTREGYYHFIVNPRGTLYDAHRPGSGTYDRSFSSSAEVKTSVRKGKGWIVTLSVPLKEAGAYVGGDQTWVMNLNRTRPARGGEGMQEWSWSILGSNDYHQVTDYGRVTGVNVPRRADGVTRTATPLPPPQSYDRPIQAGSVLVYHRLGDLEIRDGGQGLAKTIDLNIRDSAGLKIAFLARGEGVERVPLNMYDRQAGDNTTPKAYAFLSGSQWQPVVYRCDRFRYNGQPQSTVAKATDYSNLRFHGDTADHKGAVYVRSLAIYRGEDTTPPPAPADLKAQARDDGVALSWTPVKDNVGAARYVVSRAGGDGNFAKVGEVFLPEHLDRPPAGKWRYRVLAADFQDNLSDWSQLATAEVAKGFEQSKPTDPEADRAGFAQRVRGIHDAGTGKVVKGRVLCFGDSLTGATTYAADTEASLGRYAVVARGYPSQQTSFGRKKIDEDLADVNPEFCLVLLGTNNPKSPEAIPKAMEDLLAIAASCEKHGTVPVIGTIPPRGFTDPRSEPEARYNAALVKTCRDKGIPVCYLFEEFQAAGDRRRLLAGDGVHTHDQGFPAVGRAWKKAMDQVSFVLLDRAG